MADPYPTKDDPLIISGLVPGDLPQAPSTVKPPTSGGIPGLPPPGCVPGLPPPGCTILPFPCEYPCGNPPPPGECVIVPFPPALPPDSCPGSAPASGFSLVLNTPTCACVVTATTTQIAWGTPQHNRGFTFVACDNTVTIPTSGLWHIDVKLEFSCATGGGIGERVLRLEPSPSGSALDIDVRNAANNACQNTHPHISHTRALNQGNILRVRVLQNSGVCVSVGGSGHWSLFLVGDAC